MKIIRYLNALNEFSFLLQQLVKRDFKVKYKRSILGVLWSVLYPLFMMMIMVIVFQNLFRMTGGDVNYPVYIITGLVTFNFLTDATNLALVSVIGNFNLITKIYIPKYIFPLSKVLTAVVNWFFQIIALYGVIFITRQPISVLHFLLLFDVGCLFLFTLGLSLILAALMVFFRDMQYLYSLIVLAWTYMTPIFYDISLIGEKLAPLFMANPMYQYITFARTIILYNQVPSSQQFLFVLTAGIVMLSVGLIFFKKVQDKFIYYI